LDLDWDEEGDKASAQEEADSVAPLWNDSQKGKGKNNAKGQYRGLSTPLRYGRDDRVLGWSARRSFELESTL